MGGIAPVVAINIKVPFSAATTSYWHSFCVLRNPTTSRSALMGW